MNCKPGDIALVFGLPRGPDCMNDRIVQLADESAFESTPGVWSWRLTENLTARVASPFRVNDEVFLSGDDISFHSFPDLHLRPIRGVDGDDETFIWAGKPADLGVTA